jgi:type II secretory pathway component PulJ
LNRGRLTSRLRKAQLGLSLVELMVGIAVGLFVVAAAAMLVSSHLNDNRRLLLETQVQQDLRAAADIIARELRRAGHWQTAEKSVWTPDVALQLSPDWTPNTALQLSLNGNLAPSAGEATQVNFAYTRSNGDSGPFGFKRDVAVLKTLLGEGGWQELTDSRMLRITGFTVTPIDETLPLSCPKLCDDLTEACWPTLTVRKLVVDITGEAVSDPAVKRSLRSVVRLRNDWVDPTKACPA